MEYFKDISICVGIREFKATDENFYRVEFNGYSHQIQILQDGNAWIPCDVIVCGKNISLKNLYNKICESEEDQFFDDI